MTSATTPWHRISAYPSTRMSGLAICVVSIWIGILVDPARAQVTPWKAGVAKAVITPEKGVWLAGYGSQRPPAGDLHELGMKALPLEDAKGHAGLLGTNGFQGDPEEMRDRVLHQLREKPGEP